MKQKEIGTPIIVAIIVIVAIAGIGGYLVLNGGEEGVPAPAEFEVSNLTFYPSEVEVGESVTISATVKNVGDLGGTYTVELKIDGEIQETKDVTLAGGATETVSFMVTKDTSGTYTIEVNGLQRIISVSPHQEEWVYVTTFTAMTDYWYSLLDSLSEPWNRSPDEFIDYYYSYDEQFSDYFNIQGNKFKIEYHVGGDIDYGICMIFTYPEGTDIYYVSARPIYTPYALAEGTYEVNEGPGTYYCVFGTEYIDYGTIDIYDWR